MTPRPPRSTRTDTLFPSAPLFRAGGHARPVRAPDGVEQRDSVIGHAVAHHLAEAAVVGQPDMLEHADRDDAVELPGEGAIIDKLELHPVGNARLGGAALGHGELLLRQGDRSEEHTSELQSLMRTSYAVFCLKKKKIPTTTNNTTTTTQ